MWQGLVLEAKSLACERGGRLIFNNLNFVVGGGELVELRGPNGAGKSSLLRLIAKLNEPAAGSLRLSGSAQDLATQAHYIGHHEAIKPALTVKENLDFWANFQAGAANLAPFNLHQLAHDEARLLSEGQRRRLSLSRLVSVMRPIWLLDEPTVGLDQSAVTNLHDVIKAHLDMGGLVIAATHADLGWPNARVIKLVGGG